MKKHLMTYFILVVFMLSFTSLSHANGPFKKLGRGLVNIFTGWTEGFNTMGENWNKNHSVVETLASASEGAVKASLRTAIGIYETLTFSLPIPKDYKPIVLPEFAEPPSFPPSRIVLRKRVEDK